MPAKRNVAIYLYNQVEVLDFAGPFEVFSTASRVQGRLNPDSPKPFRVFTVGERAGFVEARAGLVVKTDYATGDAPPIDVLIVPGGIHLPEIDKPEVLRWIANVARSAEITASVCTGAFLLARAGVLNGRKATTHWEDIADFTAMFPDIPIDSEARWVDTGNVVTSAGISAGIDMSLHLVTRLEGNELSRLTARQMDYRWLPITGNPGDYWG